jgi:XTP/dITP diphosphohydrolase
MKLLIATHNQGKLREYRQLLTALPLDILGLDEAGITDDVEETGATFAANATLKAAAYANMAGCLALADDSGLVIDALDGRPGVYSARYGTPGLDDAGRRAYVLNELGAIPAEKRTARFMCAIALHDPHAAKTELIYGVCEGQILFADHDGGFGFGYDAIFQPAGFAQSFAQLPPAEKNRISHRGKAVAQLPDVLTQFVNNQNAT